MTILSLGIESSGTVGIALSQAPACFSMAESTILLLGGSKLVIESLEPLLRELLGEGVLELERGVTVRGCTSWCVHPQSSCTAQVRACHVVG